MMTDEAEGTGELCSARLQTGGHLLKWIHRLRLSKDARIEIQIVQINQETCYL